MFVSEIDLEVSIKIPELGLKAKIALKARCQTEAMRAAKNAVSFRHQGVVKVTGSLSKHWTHPLDRISKIASRFHSATS